MGTKTSTEGTVRTPTSWIRFRHLDWGINHLIRIGFIWTTNFITEWAIEIMHRSRSAWKSHLRSQRLFQKKTAKTFKQKICIKKTHTFKIIASHLIAIKRFSPWNVPMNKLNHILHRTKSRGRTTNPTKSWKTFLKKSSATYCPAIIRNVYQKTST